MPKSYQQISQLLNSFGLLGWNCYNWLRSSSSSWGTKVLFVFVSWELAGLFWFEPYAAWGGTPELLLSWGRLLLLGAAKPLPAPFWLLLWWFLAIACDVWWLKRDTRRSAVGDFVWCMDSSLRTPPAPREPPVPTKDEFLSTAGSWVDVTPLVPPGLLLSALLPLTVALRYWACAITGLSSWFSFWDAASSNTSSTASRSLFFLASSACDYYYASNYSRCCYCYCCSSCHCLSYSYDSLFIWRWIS